MERGLAPEQADATWSWDRLRRHATQPALRRALDLLLLDRVEVHDATGPYLAGRAGLFDVSVARASGEGTCSCGKPQPCAHAVALLAAAHRLDAERAPLEAREAPRPAFGPGDPPAPVPAFPETADDLEVPADALSPAQRAAVEAAGAHRKSAAAYSLPREQAPALAASLEALASALVAYARRPYVRFRASLRRGESTVRLVSAETPGLSVRAVLDRHGFRAVRKPRSLVHEYEGPAHALHLAAEEMAASGSAAVLAEGAPPSFEPLSLDLPPRAARPPAMPVLLSRRRFEWWTPRDGLSPLALAVLQRHALDHRDRGLLLSGDGLRNAERELVAAGLHSQRVDEAPAVLAEARAGAGEGEAVVLAQVRALPPRARDALRAHGYAERDDGGHEGPSANLPALALALAQAGVHLVPGPDGWPPIPEGAQAPAPLHADDPRVPLAREGQLVLRDDGRVSLRLLPEGSALPRSVRVELHRMGWLGTGGEARADREDAGRLLALLREAGFDARWPRPTSGEWRLASVRYGERARRDGAGTLLHLKGPLPIGRLGGVDPAAEQARIAATVQAMEEALKRHCPDARPLAHGALPGVWAVEGGAGGFLLEAAMRGASVTASAGLAPVGLGSRGVVLVDTSCLPPRLMEFRRTVGELGELRPVVSPDIEAAVRRVVTEGLEVDEQRGHYLVRSTRMGDLIEALRELGIKVLHRRLAPRGQRYARWEPRLPEDETGARPRLRPPWRGSFDGDVPGLRPETKLDPHQREGLAFILHHGHSCLLADEMGLGKTLTAIASAQFLPGRVLVVCPASARSVWKQEVHAWTTERARVLLPGEDPQEFLRTYDGEKYVVVAYSGLQKFGDALAKLSFDLVVLDESHYVKSRAAQRTRLVEERLRRIPRRLILSGTPVMNEPKEIRTQLAFVHPDEWSDTAWFGRRFQQPWKHGTPEVREQVLARLRQYLEGVMLRREKRQALPDLPDKRLHVHRLPLPPAARRAYDEAEDEFRDYLGEHEDTALTGGMATTAGRLERLKQTALVGKLPLILDGVRALLDKGEKVVVFCHYREPIKAIAKELAPHGVVTITGATDAAERGEIVQRFQRDPQTRVFVGQTLAAGVAVTLTAARHAVFCDLEWNPALHRQAMDRIHRKTQTRDVDVHFYLAEDTVEEDIAEVLEEKTEMMDMLLEGRAGGGFGLRDKEAAQREVALRILSRRRRLAATAGDEDED